MELGAKATSEMQLASSDAAATEGVLTQLWLAGGSHRTARPWCLVSCAVAYPATGATPSVSFADSSLEEGAKESYVYNADGLRTSKTVNGVEHKYIWQGDKLVSEAYGGRELEFFYDESGKPYAMSHRSGPNAEAKLYYYVTNLQGDVLSLVDAEGFSAAEYWYNAWGLPMGSSGAMAEVNPLRYRGYYFDQETGLYYLKSRYYDPFVCRFVNADDYASTGQGFIGTNMFAYCINNPVGLVDSTGMSPSSFESGLLILENSIFGLFESIHSSFFDFPANFFDMAAELFEFPSNILAYKEHSKKGTTNPANRKKHQEGQARKKRDHGGEKGDLRRRGNPNKRHSSLMLPTGEMGRIAGGVTAAIAAIGLIYLIVNDVTGVGAADDAAIIPVIEVFRRGVSAFFA